MFQVATVLLVGQAHASWHHVRPTMVVASSEGQQQDKVTLVIVFESVYNGNHIRMFIF